MKIKKIIFSLFLIVFSLTFVFTNKQIIKAETNQYYVVGSFNKYTLDEKYQMTFNEGIYSYILTTDKENVQFAISDKTNLYKTEGINKGTNFLIENIGQYKISFNPLKLDTQDFLKIEPVEETSFYIQGLNGYELNDENKLSYLGNDEYEYIITVTKKVQFYITDGTKNYYNINGDDYFINEEGTYQIKFYNKLTHYVEITKEEKTYYIKGSFNNFTISDSYLMKENLDNLDFEEYYFIISNKKLSTFYITDKISSWQDGNKDFVLEDTRDYKIYFSPNKLYDNGLNVKIEAINYYILCEDNNFTINQNYILNLNQDNKKYVEFTYSIKTTSLFQFKITDGNNVYDNNGGNFVIKEKGSYNIYFSKDHLYESNSNVLIKEEEISFGNFYLVGNFNEYEIQEENMLQHNTQNKDYYEYLITLDLKKNDQFYITDKVNKWQDLNGNNFVIPYDGTYVIYFSLNHDYGNGYHVYYAIERVDIEEEHTFIINTKDDLINFINDANLGYYGKNITVEIANDINMENTTINPIAIFNGILNGNYNKIYNFNLNDQSTGGELGFIRKLTKGSSINSLTLEYEYETSSDTTVVGGIVGINYGEIINCNFYGKLIGRNIVGGIAGSNETDGYIYNSNNFASIIGHSFVGGIAGLNKATIKNCINNGNINKASFASKYEDAIINIGGITGFNTGIIIKAVNIGEISTSQTGNFVGGISGSSVGEIESSYNTGRIRGNNYIGGIVGHYALLNSKKNNDNYNNIIKQIEDILNGYEDIIPNITFPKPEKEIISTLKYCYNLGDVSGESTVGGIAGYASNDSKKPQKDDDNFNIEVCFNKGNITSTGGYVGGICGEHIIGIISDSFNTGIIEAKTKDYVGGISGSSTGTIKNSFAICNLKGHNFIGGISGYIKKVNNCYTIVNIYSEGINLGAIAGEAEELNEDIFNNFFVYTGVEGLDNANIFEKAERIDRFILASKDILTAPLDFNAWCSSTKEKSYPILRKMEEKLSDNLLREVFYKEVFNATSFTCDILFCDEDGTILYSTKVPYGTDFNLDNLPSIKNKDGYFVKWEDFESKNITSSLVVSLVYTKITTSIASESGPTPQIIVEGNFYPTTKVSVMKGSNNYLGDSSTYKSFGTYQVELTDNDNGIMKQNFKVRVRIPDGSKNPVIGIILNETLVLADSKVEGNYLVFNLEDASEFMIIEKQFFTLKNPDFIKLIITIVVISFVIIIITIIIIVLVKTKKKKPQEVPNKKFKKIKKE